MLQTISKIILAILYFETSALALTSGVNHTLVKQPFKSKCMLATSARNSATQVYFNGPVVSILGDDLYFRRRLWNKFYFVLALPETKSDYIPARKFIQEVSGVYKLNGFQSASKILQRAPSLLSRNVSDAHYTHLFMTQSGKGLEIFGNAPMWIGLYRDRKLIKSTDLTQQNETSANLAQSLKSFHINSTDGFSFPKSIHRWSVKSQDILVVCPAGLKDNFRSFVRSAVNVTCLLGNPFPRSWIT